MIALDKPLERRLDVLVAEHGERQKTRLGGAAFGEAAFLVGSRMQHEGGDFHVAHIARCALPETADDATGDVHSRTVDAEWIADHGARLVRLLPGGVDVVGLLWLADKKLKLDPRPMLLEAMHLLAKSAAALTTLGLEKPLSQMALVSVEFPLGRPQGVVFDVTRRGLSSGSPTRVAFTQLEWIPVQSSVAFDFAIALADEKPLNNFHLQFTAAIKDWCAQLLACDLALIDGRFRSANESIAVKTKEQGKRRGGNEGAPPITVHLLMPADTSCATEVLTLRPQCALTVHIEQLLVEAAVPARSTVGDVIQAVKHHIIRSLASRAELHYESTEVVEDEAKDRVSVHQLPRRACASLPGQAAIVVCDFLFESDSNTDARETFKQLLDVDIAIESIETNAERALSDGDLSTIRLCSANETVSTELHRAMLGAGSTGGIGSRNVQRQTTVYLVALSALVAIIAVVAFLLMKTTA